MHQYSVGSVAAMSVGKLLAYVAITVFGTLTLRAAILADIAAYGLGYILLSIAHAAAAGKCTTGCGLPPGGS